MTVVLRYIIVAPPFCYAQLSTADYRKNTPKRSHLFRIFFQKNFSSLPGLFPKSPSTVPFLSNFFKKFYLFTTAIAKTPRKGHTLSELFSKKALPSTGGISKTTHLCVAAFRKNPKKSSPHHWLSRLPPHFVAPVFNFSPKKHNLLPRLYPKRHPVVLLLSEKIPQKTSSPTTDCRNPPPVLLHPFSTFFQKFLSLHCWLSLFCPQKVTPLSGIFSKKVLLATPVTIAFFLRFVSALLKNLPERE